jgi:choline dehydrogenase-like flavoprotein
MPADRHPHLYAFARAAAPGVETADLDAAMVALSAENRAADLDALESVLANQGGGPQYAEADLTALLADERLSPAALAGVRFAQQARYGNPRGLPEAEVSSWREVGFRQTPPGVTWPDPTEVLPSLPTVAEPAAHYDVVVIGSGAGSVVARLAAEAGARVLVIDRGTWLGAVLLEPDHLRNQRVVSGLNTPAGPPGAGNPRVLERAGASASPGGVTVLATDAGWHNNAMTLGGGTRVYGAQAWRLCTQDFAMASTYGVPDGSSLADWPIGYTDLAPFYDRVEQEMGVSGDPAGNAFAGERSHGYPMPPMPLTPSGRLLRAGADRLGWRTGPVPLLINSVDYDGRLGCRHCGACVGFACRSDSKNGTHNTVLPLALATGRTDLLLATTATRLVSNPNGRVTGVAMVGPFGTRVIDAGQVVVAAGAIESARLLLLSATDREPHGLGNNTDQVGRHLQGHVYTGAVGLVDEQVQFGDGPGPSISVNDFRHGNAGIVGGGMLANDFVPLPLATLAVLAGSRLIPRWGRGSVDGLRRYYTRHVHVMGPVQEVTTADARVRLDPHVTDAHGLPVARLSGDLHPEDLRAAHFMADRAAEWLEASGVHDVRAMRPGAGPHGPSGGQHQAGTCRMGDDPATSVVDPHGRLWGHDNVRLADGSVHVTNGGVNPVLTILANAWRTGELMLAQM